MVNYYFYTSWRKTEQYKVWRTNTGWGSELNDLKDFETKSIAELDFFSILYDNADFAIGEYIDKGGKQNGAKKNKIIKPNLASFVESNYYNDDIHKFSAVWSLKDATFTKDKGKVFSCFPCGGGSTMGYKLAGFDVIGGCEIDEGMMACYIKNHNPKYPFLMPIQKFKLNYESYPEELYHLDILDGSPPCSSFSLAGDRQVAWGKEKVFREGQELQVLDTLFFDFIEVAKELQPKVVVAENVEGLLMGEAKDYVRKINELFDKAGYYVQHTLLDASKMGVPQRRRRVFFIAFRKDLAIPFLQSKDMFDVKPKLNLDFSFPEIKFGQVRSPKGIDKSDTERGMLMSYRIKTDKDLGSINSRVYNKVSGFNAKIRHDDEVCGTICAGETDWRFFDGMACSDYDYCACGTYPTDYDFLATSADKVKYMVGMSVPPVMMAQIATRIYDQWLSKI